MIPKNQDDLKQNFTFATLPSKTFKMNFNDTIRGSVDDVEALKQAIFLILNTERYEWLIHTWNYGVEFRNLIGKDIDYCSPEIERVIREALLQDDRLTAVQNFEFEVNKNKVLTTFTVTTIYGDIEIKQGVDV